MVRESAVDGIGCAVGVCHAFHERRVSQSVTGVMSQEVKRKDSRRIK